MTLQNYSGRLFFANRVSLSCTVSANWRPKGQKKFRRMGVTSPGVGFATPGVGFTTRRLGKTNRRVGNTNRRLRKTTRRLVKATSPTMYMTWICPFLRARVYEFDFPKKVFTPSHRARFPLIFRQFECECFEIKAFTHGRTLVKGWKEEAFTSDYR